MPKITNIKGREILDSRGNPTVKAIITLDNGRIADAAVPSGASTGTYEAFELRDNDPQRYDGKGVLKAVENIGTKINGLLKGEEIGHQQEIDRKMIEEDGTGNKKNFGANSILAVSLAYARVSAYSLGMPLYKYLEQISGIPRSSCEAKPIFNIINGGLHGSGNITIQEFIIIPQREKFSRNLQTGVELYHQLKKTIVSRKLYAGIGDEGGFTPNLNSNTEVLDLIKQTIGESSYQDLTDVRISLDLAASTFYSQGYYYPAPGKPGVKDNAFIDYIKMLVEKYHLFSVEDALYEDDWDGWKRLSSEINENVLVVGDDLLATNKQRLEKAIALKACNSIIIKVNQVGTLTETLDVIKSARAAGFKIIISHRSGETNDDFIADLAVGTSADFVKFGAPARGERVIKYNRLSEIYKEIGITQ